MTLEQLAKTEFGPKINIKYLDFFNNNYNKTKLFEKIFEVLSDFSDGLQKATIELDEIFIVKDTFVDIVLLKIFLEEKLINVKYRIEINYDNCKEKITYGLSA